MALRDGLVGVWCPSLGTTAGTLLDRSGRNNHGTLTNMDPATDWVQSGGRGALDFDGSNDEVTTPAMMPAVAARSMSAWVLTRTTGTQWFFGSGFNAASAAFIVGIQDAAWGVTQYGAFVGSTAAAANVWAHIAVVNAGTQWTIYANGIAATGTMTTTLAAYPVFLGSYGGGGYWNGQIDDVAIWNRSLTPPEIRQLYTQGRGGWLQQTRRRTYGFIAAGFRSYWARRQSQIIGGGT